VRGTCAGQQIIALISPPHMSLRNRVRITAPADAITSYGTLVWEKLASSATENDVLAKKRRGAQQGPRRPSPVALGSVGVPPRGD
jgi:hypothetical protein